MREQQGFTLIEVLVTLVILSVGLLGVAKLEHLSWALTSTPGIQDVWHQ